MTLYLHVSNSLVNVVLFTHVSFWSTSFIFLIYHTKYKGYKCYDHATKKIFISYHVTFEEMFLSFGFMIPNHPPSCDFLNVDPEPSPSILQFLTSGMPNSSANSDSTIHILVVDLKFPTLFLASTTTLAVPYLTVIQAPTTPTPPNYSRPTNHYAKCKPYAFTSYVKFKKY